MTRIQAFYKISESLAIADNSCEEEHRYSIKYALAYLRPDNTFARSINFLLKSVASAGGLTSFSRGLNPL
jgi:hypothetical protein